MHYFDIPTIRHAIEQLQDYSANWLLPSFVFAANNVGTEDLVDMSKRLGTDQFLDRYFNGRRLGLPDLPHGNNLLRPRLKGINWDRGEFANDYLVQQDTKMWGNLFSSRGYREMRLEGVIEGERAIVRLTESFQPRFEYEIPANFRFEDFLVWLFAFEGMPDEVGSWSDLFDYLLHHELELSALKPPYQTRFRLTEPPVPWPTLLSRRPTDKQFLEQLAPRLLASLENPRPEPEPEAEGGVGLSPDDPIYATVTAAINSQESLAFLLAGPPGTGKTLYARQIANSIAEGDSNRTLFLQFHPAIGYDDFVEGFRPAPSASGTGIQYQLAPRLFLNFAKVAADDPEKMFAMVIDELNRGDVARVFGEVLTYIEADYRGVQFTLPLSGEKVSLPRNLVVIATANPYDRSVTDLDDALLRRFWVIEIEPNGALLRNHLQLAGVPKGVVNRTLQVFSILNRSFPHGFGHTCFLRVRSVDDLAQVWSGRVRLALRRAFIQDRAMFDATSAEIESLLNIEDDEVEGVADEASEPEQP